MGEFNDDHMVRSDFLFATPSFWSGVARLFDFFGQFDFYNVSRTPEEADCRAIYSDWRVTGQDLRHAMVTFHQEHKTKQGNLFDYRAA